MSAKTQPVTVLKAVDEIDKAVRSSRTAETARGVHELEPLPARIEGVALAARDGFSTSLPTSTPELWDRAVLNKAGRPRPAAR